MPGRYALIVATDTYGDPKLRRLRAPARDAEALADVLRDPAIGGFEVELASNENDAALRRRIATFFSDRARDSLLLLHFSCHGLKDDSGQLYFAAADTEVAHLDATAIPAEFVSRQMARSRSNNVLMLLDCCYSGAIARGLRFRAGDSVDVDDHLGGSGRVIITASNAMEYAFEGDELTGEGQPSVFTSAVVKALETGEADRDQDSWISVRELYDYVCDEVREVTPNQRPNMLSHLEGQLFVARSRWVAPATLPRELLDGLGSPAPAIREGAVNGLAELLHGRDRGLAAAARSRLESVAAGDDSRRVSSAAAAALVPPAPASVAAAAAATTVAAPTPPRVAATPPPPAAAPQADTPEPDGDGDAAPAAAAPQADATAVPDAAPAAAVSQASAAPEADRNAPPADAAPPTDRDALPADAAPVPDGEASRAGAAAAAARAVPVTTIVGLVLAIAGILAVWGFFSPWVWSSEVPTLSADNELDDRLGFATPLVAGLLAIGLGILLAKGRALGAWLAWLALVCFAACGFGAVIAIIDSQGGDADYNRGAFLCGIGTLVAVAIGGWRALMTSTRPARRVTVGDVMAPVGGLLIVFGVQSTGDILNATAAVPATLAGLVVLAAPLLAIAAGRATRPAALAAAAAGAFAIGAAGMAEADGRPEIVLGGVLAVAGGVLAFRART